MEDLKEIQQLIADKIKESQKPEDEDFIAWKKDNSSYFAQLFVESVYPDEFNAWLKDQYEQTYEEE